MKNSKKYFYEGKVSIVNDHYDVSTIIPLLCYTDAMIYVLWASMARNASRNAVVRMVDPAIL